MPDYILRPRQGGPIYPIKARSIKDAMVKAEKIPTLRKGWKIEWPDHGKSNLMLRMNIFNSKGRLEEHAYLIRMNLKARK